MTHADSSPALLGRSRDTGSLGAALPPDIRPPRLRRVILRVWGLTQAEAADAEAKARSAPGSSLWDIIDVVSSHGGLCPIPARDPLVLGQGADYGQAWAAHPARTAT
jgi:hypothetical protein